MNSEKNKRFEDIKLIKRGKVRDVYEIDDNLLIVASDRISAFDVVMDDLVPDKGKILTSISLFWFKKLEPIIENHLISADPEDYPEVCRKYAGDLEGRSMLVKKATPLPVECIVRGYLSGSGWLEYRSDGKICGISLPKGLKESEKLSGPIFTPSTKAMDGMHDENITFEKAVEILGEETAEQVRRISIEIYEFGRDLFAKKGIIVADTKFEFGISDDRLILIDEVLTPDSSRFWPMDEYMPGGQQKSFDKQFLRDYLIDIKWPKKLPPPELPQNIIEKTREKYLEALKRLTGQRQDSFEVPWSSRQNHAGRYEDIRRNMDQDNQDLFAEKPEESFEELLNQNDVKPVYLNPGEAVEAVIIKITKEWVFIDLGGKSEGYILIDEFIADEGDLTIKEGDTITAFFLSSRNNEMLFTTRLASGTVGNKYLEEAYHNRIPVEGLVEQEIKGGFDVKITGNTRAFCPYSQMGLNRVENADQYLGQHLTFKIIEYAEKGRNIIVSNRTVLQEERQKQKDALRESLKEGMTVSGEITSIMKFGAFVDIGGIEGLIPISEISWGRVEDINTTVSVGQKVDVAIKKLDWGNDKFSFSLKEILPDPWNDILLKYPEGSIHKGKVAHLVPFGAFVTLEPGIEGLIHISELGKHKRINHPREILEENQVIQVKIVSVDQAAKRLSLTMTSDDGDTDEIDSYKKYITTSKSASGAFGTLGDILQAKINKKIKK